MLKITEVGHGMKVVEIHGENRMRCCWENADGRRWTSDFKYSYSPEHGFRSFTYNYTDYEYDEYTNRYYYWRDSSSLRPEMDGAVVRERIGKAAYMEIYGQLLEYLGMNEKEEAETIETTEPCPECETAAERNESTASEPEQNRIPQEAKEVFEEVVRPAVNALYKTADELAKLLSAFAESCMMIQNARPPP